MNTLTKFEAAYLTCALWSSTDIDTDITLDDLTCDAIAKAIEDCDKFIELAGELLDDVNDEQAGHDFWLTRNHHGAGFWDRGLGEVGDKLTYIAHSFNEINFYIDDKRKLNFDL